MSATEIESLLARANSVAEFDFPVADAILRNATTLARNVFGVESPHVAELGHVRFRSEDTIYNSGRYMNRVHWNEGVERLRRVLHSMAYELKVINMRSELLPPKEVTLKWLFHHVSVGRWLIAGGLLSAAFGLGLYAAKNDLFAKIMALSNIAPTP